MKKHPRIHLKQKIRYFAQALNRKFAALAPGWQYSLLSCFLLGASLLCFLHLTGTFSIQPNLEKTNSRPKVWAPDNATLGLPKPNLQAAPLPGLRTYQPRRKSKNINDEQNNP